MLYMNMNMVPQKFLASWDAVLTKDQIEAFHTLYKRVTNK